MQNAVTLDDSIQEAKLALQKDVAVLLRPEPEIGSTRRMESRHFDIDRVKILENKKVKVPGSRAVTFATTVLTILVLGYK